MKKPSNVKIIQILVDRCSQGKDILGLGDDGLVYYWRGSLQRWELFE